MNYTLRIINQTHSGAEERRNSSLGTDYDVLMKTSRTCPDTPNRFEQEQSKHFNIADTVIDQTLVGFVFSKDGVRHPIRDFEVAYIVNENGQTFERVYGQYERY